MLRGVIMSPDVYRKVGQDTQLRRDLKNVCNGGLVKP